MQKPKITPNMPGLPCYRENSPVVQSNLNKWRKFENQNTFKESVSMGYWELKSGCTAL